MPFIKSIFLLIIVITLSSCTSGMYGYTPLTSMARLARLDVASVDVEQLRVAIRVPQALATHKDSAQLVLELWKKGDSTKSRNTFILQQIEQSHQPAALQKQAETGFHFFIFRLKPEDAAQLTALQQRYLKTGYSRRPHGSLSVSAVVCKTAPVIETGPILMTTYLKLGQSKSYIPLVKNTNLRAVAEKSGITAFEPCVSQLL